MTPRPSVGRLIAEADRCVACGLCVPQCPSHQAVRSEVDSPRGRIFVMRAMLEGTLSPGADSAAALDRCLGCGQCEAVCPNSVRFGELLHGTKREFSLRNPSRMARMLAWGASSPARLGAAGLVMALLGAPFVSALAERFMSWLRFPPVPRLRRMPPIWGEHPLRDEKGRVHVFVGCYSRLLDGETLAASVKMVNACGHGAVVSREQGCCGSLARQLGSLDEADRLREQNNRAFSGAQQVVYAASGCRSGAGGRGADICAFVAEHGGALTYRQSNTRVLVHEPCTARHAPGGAAPVAELLKKVPGTQAVCVRNTMECCGAAGSYHIHSPQVAGKLQESMLDDLLRVAGPERPLRLITSNYGCGLFLGAGLARRRIGVRVQHPVSFLAEHLES